MNIRRTPWTSDVRTVRRHQDVGVKRHAIAIDCKATGQVRRRGIEIWPRCFFRVRSSGDSISFALTLAIDEPTVRHAALALLRPGAGGPQPPHVSARPHRSSPRLGRREPPTRCAEGDCTGSEPHRPRSCFGGPWLWSVGRGGARPRTRAFRKRGSGSVSGSRLRSRNCSLVGTPRLLQSIAKTEGGLVSPRSRGASGCRFNAGSTRLRGRKP